MFSQSIFISFMITIFVSRIHSFEHEVDEYEKFSINCLSGESIRINEANWRHKRTSISNMFTINWRNYGYIWGGYLGMCAWNVAKEVGDKCDGKSKCDFVPTRGMFGDCGYIMFLNVDYDCVPYCQTTPVSACQRRSKRSGNATPSTSCSTSRGLTFSDVVNILEARYGSQRRNDLGAITHITTRDVQNHFGKNIQLVCVMRARLTRNALQDRETMPRQADSRMTELNRLPGDERGHLLASTLGGPSHVLNIAPQHCELNRVPFKGGWSWWWMNEDNIRKLIMNSVVEHVDWTLIVRYGGLQSCNFRPTGFAIQYSVHFINGTIQTGDVYFPNVLECGAIAVFPDDWFAP